LYDRRSFYRNNPVVRFSKGEVIFLIDEVPKCIYSIKSGVVEESSITADGNRQSIFFEIIGDIFPKSWAFARTNRTLFEYTALTDCELYVISRDEFLTQIAYNIDFAKKMLDRSISVLMGNKLKIDALERPHAEQKLIYTFRYLSLLYGSGRSNGMVRIEVPLTQQDLAELTGLTRETTNMELTRLKQDKVIINYQKFYTVNTVKLNEKIDKPYEPDKSLSLLRKKIKHKQTSPPYLELDSKTKQNR
jgi:CRP-like cAMP-binding protein